MEVIQIFETNLFIIWKKIKIPRRKPGQSKDVEQRIWIKKNIPK